MGIVGLASEFQGRISAEVGQYMWAIRQTGHKPVLGPSSPDDVDEFLDQPDLVAMVVTGGYDLSAHHYNGDPRLIDYPTDPRRDAVDLRVVETVAERSEDPKRAIPAILSCRAYHALNVVRGGTLYEDIPHAIRTTGEIPASSIEHRQRDRSSPYAKNHVVTIPPGSQLHTCIGPPPDPANGIARPGSTRFRGARLLSAGTAPYGLAGPAPYGLAGSTPHGQAGSGPHLHVRGPHRFVPAGRTGSTRNGDVRWLADGSVEADTNSRHHQAVKKIGDGLRPAAWTEDGVVEALELEGANGRFIAVQFHIEELDKWLSRRILQWVIPPVRPFPAYPERLAPKGRELVVAQRGFP